MIEKDFVPYEPSLDMKELGFDEPCFGVFSFEKFNFGIFSSLSLTENTILAPTFSQAFRWFREEYDLFGCIDLQVCTPSHWFIRVDKIEINDYLYHSEDENIRFNTYEEAELACLRKLIEIVKSK